MYKRVGLWLHHLFHRQDRNTELPGQKLKDINEPEILSDLAGTIEHEIMSPLAIMEMEISRLKLLHSADKELVRHLDDLEKQRLRIFETTSLISLLVRRDRLRPLRLERTDLKEVLHKAIQNTKRRLNKPYLMFHVSGRNIFAMVEAELLTRAMECLLLNFARSIQATNRQDDSSIDIHLSASAPLENNVAIQITDIARDIGHKGHFELADLFGDQYTLSRKDRFCLFLVQNVVQQHEGSIIVKQVRGNSGVALSLFLPQNENGSLSQTSHH
jgi:K+-sensing histidine kinase KdpD